MWEILTSFFYDCKIYFLVKSGNVSPHFMQAIFVSLGTSVSEFPKIKQVLMNEVKIKVGYIPVLA